jgi:hypothetical protein
MTTHARGALYQGYTSVGGIRLEISRCLACRFDSENVATSSAKSSAGVKSHVNRDVNFFI